MSERISGHKLDFGVMRSLSHTNSHWTAGAAAHSYSNKARLRQLRIENAELRDRAVELILLIQWMRDEQAAANSNVAVNSNVPM